MSIKIETHRKFKKILKIAPIVAKAEWSTFIVVVLGTVIYTFGVMSLTVPFRFPDSGVTGVAMLINYTTGTSLPLMVGAANVVLLIWAWRELSVRMVLWTIFAVLLMTVLMKVMDGIPFAHTDQKLLIAMLSGAVKGYGGALVLRTGGSLGGLDVVILYLQKKYGIEIGKYNFYINMCVIGASSFVVGLENAMLGLVSVYTAGVAIDHTLSSFDKRRLILVVTKTPASVLHFVMSELGRGATVIEAHGGYSGEDRPIVMCLLTRRQSVDLKRFLAGNEPGDFMVVSDASEVVGKGFKPWRSL